MVNGVLQDFPGVNLTALRQGKHARGYRPECCTWQGDLDFQCLYGTPYEAVEVFCRRPQWFEVDVLLIFLAVELVELPCGEGVTVQDDDLETEGQGRIG